MRLFAGHHNLRAVLLVALSALILGSCVNIKSDYPEISYYGLKQEPAKSHNKATVPGILQIRSFSGSDAVSTDQIHVAASDNTITPLYWHRWIAEMPQMLTDYFVLRFNNFKSFSGGTINASTMLVPDFVLEGELLDMTAHGAIDKDDTKADNYAELTLRISLIKRNPGKIQKELVLNKTYTVKSKRADGSPKSIAPAFSSACADLFENLMVDVQTEIARFNLKEK